MRTLITIVIDHEIPLDDTARESFDALADVMLVQAEDGLYTGGWQDSDVGGELVGTFDHTSIVVEHEL